MGRLHPLGRPSPERRSASKSRKVELRQNQLSLRLWPDYPAIVATCCQAWNALMTMPERLASITRPGRVASTDVVEIRPLWRV
jgi:hypothetical protein